MNTNKPLSEWTLGEIKSECKRCNGNCIYAVCPMVKWISKDEMACVIIRELRKPTPASWDLSELPRWTEQDKEDAKMIKRVFNGFQIGIVRDTLAQLCTIAKDGYPSEYINSDMFPSLKPGESATLDEIIGGTNE